MEKITENSNVTTMIAQLMVVQLENMILVISVQVALLQMVVIHAVRYAVMV